MALKRQKCINSFTVNVFILYTGSILSFMSHDPQNICIFLYEYLNMQYIEQGLFYLIIY